MYRFLENFETGIPFIDNGHRRLLEDMEEAREALAAGHEDEYHRLSGQLLATMHDHIVKQHVYEEEIMAMSRDGELADQKEAHAHFREVIDRHKSSMNFQNDHEELTSLLHFLNEWFLQHILSSDVLIGSALKKAKAAAVEAKARAAKEARAAETTLAEESANAAKTAHTGEKTTAEQATVNKTEAKPSLEAKEQTAQSGEAPAAPEKKAAKKRTAAKKQATSAAPANESGKTSAPAAKTAEPAKKAKKAAAKKPTAEKAKAAATPAPAAKTAAKTAAPKPNKPATTVIKAKKEPADPFAFTDEFRTQIPLVDKEHETLFDLVRQTYELVHDEFRVDKFDDIIEIIEELRDYTIKHFADEERYMKSINYDGLAEQVAAHTAFVEKLNNIDFDEIDRDQEDALDKLIKFLLNWLVQHILKVDKKMPYIEEAASKLTE